MTTNKSSRSRFCRMISGTNAVHPVRLARQDFFGSVTLVCSIGILVKLIQLALAH